eukprot:CAMPEP_0197735126 /NCGR_PEP_ID=MMETSP1435-20131217/320_1 /TAXON_ID=426625 /ORGANISM="Chaetoceros brevis, Strain CCMP164" /LENGTH=259 /DNA_ID=CAMNT_0043322703 /DNA_START=71 /DNA_END=853 /DNA_ORIENTATION=-
MCDGGGGGDFGGWGGNNYGNGGGGKMPWWVPLIFTSCFSVIALIVGVITLASSISKQSWAEATGTVIGINTPCSRSVPIAYSATVEYEVDGQIYQYSDSCSLLKPTVGNESRVLYDPNEPSDGASGTFVGLWLVPIIAGVSIIVCGVGICIVQNRRKTNNSANPSGQSMDTGNATSSGMGMASSQPGQTSSSTYPAATGTSTFASSLGGDTAAAPAPTSQPVQSSYGYNTSTSSSAPASTQNNNSSGKPSIFDQMSSGV